MAEFNKGDVSEGILAAAITARFLSKTKKITSNDVISVIKKLNNPINGSKGLTSISKFESENDNKIINDDVICKVNLAELNMKAFLNSSTYNDRKVISIVNSAVAYANGPYIMEWADMMYTNNQKNKIEINAEGLLDQSGTKVDLRVLIDDKQVGVGVSLKAGDVKQFGQVGGTKWESMLELFNSFGINFSNSVKTQYLKLLSEKQLAPALTLVYSEAVNEIQKMQKENLIKSLSSFINHHATRGEKDVVLVQLNKEEAKIYDFSNLSNKLIGIDVHPQLSTTNTDKLQGYEGGSKIPKIDFIIKSTNKSLITIRLKLEGNRVSSKGKRLPLTVRSYVEKGPELSKLIAK